MKTTILRGVPLVMRQDGWWLDEPPAPRRNNRVRRRRDSVRAAVLLALIALADVLVWDAAPGINLALLGGAIVAGGLTIAWPQLAPRTRLGIAAGTVLSLLPLVELVQPLSVLIALCGLSLCGAALAGLPPRDLWRGALRLWWVAPVQTVTDGAAGLRQVNDIRLPRSDMRTLVMGWALPIGATAVFAMLIIGANPILDRALSQLADWHLPAPDMWRLWFWAFMGALIWPALVARRMHERLRARKPERMTVQREGVINATSVARSLIAFNALFAVQTGMDVLFLYGNAGLPDGITAAAYAHRGAYPLLITALLAGLFAVLARPYLAGRPVLRWLMLIWLAQTMALVVASLWRLETYVDIYGLTRLRLAAYIWMGLVAAGLALVTWQVWRDRPTGWMILRSTAMGAVTLYVCAFINFDGAIASHNLTRKVERDTYALCQLSEGALPAMTLHWKTDPARTCKILHYVHPHLFQPADWREWGFRNWRVRRSLAAMTTETMIP